MGLISQLPKGSTPLVTFNRFTATFNTPTLGAYDFRIPANQRQFSQLKMQNQYYYRIDKLYYTVTIPEAEYTTAINVMPQIRLRFSQSDWNVYPNPISLALFFQGLDLNYWFHNNKGNQNLQMSFNGVLNQTPAMVGITELIATVVLVLYEVSSLEAVGELRSPSQDKFSDYREVW